ncbi:MAG: nuclear transport factor 2 family protein [Desulfobacteraceae bacterium]|nr:nuclear transport factor 2 family protein [Desulfobacteraceae bacterium]
MNNYGELESVKSVINKYIDGSFKADVGLLKSVFHENAKMSGYLGDRLLIGGPEPFFEDLESRPSMFEKNDPYKAYIININITGSIASVILYETGFFGNAGIEDHFHLIRDKEGAWKIIAKTFTTVE